MTRRIKCKFSVAVVTACTLLAGVTLGACSSREQRAENYVKNGTEYLQKKEFPKARVEFRNAIQLKKDNIKAWRGLAEIDEHDRNLQGLVQDLVRITELDDNDAGARIKLARFYMLGGALEKALKLADAASKLEPKNASIFAIKAAVLYRQKDPSRAREQIDKALAIDPHNADALVVVATQQLIKGDAPAALKTLSNLNSKSDTDTGVILLKINAYNTLGNLEQVESLLHKLIALNPKNAAFRAQLIRFYLAHDRKDDAEKALRVRAKAESGNPAAELDLVSFLNSFRGYESARSELQKRIEAGGDVFPFEMALANLDFRNGKAQNAIDRVNQILKTSTASDQITTARLNSCEHVYVAKETRQGSAADFQGSRKRQVQHRSFTASCAGLSPTK